jgi:hypothetical protein
VLLALVVVVAQGIAEARTGSTAGNALTGIRTMSNGTGAPAGALAILVRQLVVAAGALALLVGQWVVVTSGAWDASPAQRGWHDKAAGTLVLRARAVRARSAGPVGPRSRAAGPVPADVEIPAVERTASVGAGVDLVREAPAAGPGRDRSAERAPVPLITGVPGVEAPRPEVVPVVSPVIDVPSTLAVPAPPPPGTSPGLLTGPRPDLTRSPLVRAADPLLGELERAADAPAVDDDLGEVELTRLRPPTPARVVHLRFDTGEELDVTGDGLVGRSPAQEAGVVHLVAVDDPDRSISKTHLAFGLEPGDGRLWVADRGSINGTILVDPDGVRAALPHGTRAVVERGWTVRFGRRSLVVEDR